MFQKKSLIARYLAGFVLCAGLIHAAVGETTPLNKAEMAKVETILTKVLKGKPTLQSGKKEELDTGWKITCTATVGSGGDYDLVVMAEKSMTLGYIDSQMPHKADAPAMPDKSAPAKNATPKKS